MPTVSRRQIGRRRPPRARPGVRSRRDARTYQQHARRQLRRFRQGSVLAVALTAILLLIWGVPATIEGEGQPPPTETEAVQTDPIDSVAEAGAAINDLAASFLGFLPRLALAIVLIALAALAGRLARSVLERNLGGWPRTAALTAVTRLAIFLAAAVAVVSVLAGDVRAVVGSVGLLGLAASWALQTPIESFTGWLLNAFRGYYRVGDRIAVGEVVGDVYRIDVLTTTVWETGGPGKRVSAEQATGALITVPNWEVLRSNIVNFSRDFPYVWDEIATAVAHESDLGYCAEVLEGLARRELGDEMVQAAAQYTELLKAERLLFDVDEVPRVYLSSGRSWTDCTIRYLVPIRSRRRWSSALTLAISRELGAPQHRGRIIPVYPRQEVVVRQDWPGPEAPP